MAAGPGEADHRERAATVLWADRRRWVVAVPWEGRRRWAAQVILEASQPQVEVGL